MANAKSTVTAKSTTLKKVKKTAASAEYKTAEEIRLAYHDQDPRYVKKFLQTLSKEHAMLLADKSQDLLNEEAKAKAAYAKKILKEQEALEEAQRTFDAAVLKPKAAYDKKIKLIKSQRSGVTDILKSVMKTLKLKQFVTSNHRLVEATEGRASTELLRTPLEIIRDLRELNCSDDEINACLKVTLGELKKLNGEKYLQNISKEDKDFFAGVKISDMEA